MNKYLGEPPSLPPEAAPPQTAKGNRERLFSRPATILEEEAKKAIAVRENMKRLRELRLAKEAQEVRTEIPTGNDAAKPKPKKRFR